MKCCKPQIKIVASALGIGGSTLLLTTNRLISSIPINENFCLCIPFGMIPNQDTILAGPVIITDTNGTLIPARLVCTGNNLHVDSLRTFFLRNVCRNCDDRRSCCGVRQINGCCSFDFNCFYGADTPHITFCHKMCPSIFGTAALPTNEVIVTTATSTLVAVD